ncbi:helicase associated domain-containing protein [Arthrobacter methylotrophus]|uniref:Helicase associated domain-containing protein n=1 Tax=Arthrobacter methylotrophus TaxID=121291 RepID=A0ABV5UQK8_9MICC
MNTLTIPAPSEAPAQQPAAGDGTDPWTEMAASVALFVERTGNLPVPGAEPAEDEMAGWLAVQRRAAQQGRMAGPHRSFLDTRIPAWRQSRQERWNSQLALLAETRSAGAPVRGQLKVWLKSQRRTAAAGNLTADRKAALDAVAPGWDQPAPGAEYLWLSRAEDLANYVDFSGRLPASAGGTAEATGLYRWMSYQRVLARSDRLTKARRKWLDKNVPGWLPEHDAREVHWSARAKALEVFREETGRWPSVAVAAEKTLARWLGTQRAAARAGQMGTERLEALDAAAVGWLQVRQGA